MSSRPSPQQRHAQPGPALTCVLWCWGDTHRACSRPAQPVPLQAQSKPGRHILGAGWLPAHWCAGCLVKGCGEVWGGRNTNQGEACVPSLSLSGESRQQPFQVLGSSNLTQSMAAIHEYGCNSSNTCCCPSSPAAVLAVHTRCDAATGLRRAAPVRACTKTLTTTPVQPAGGQAPHRRHIIHS